MPAQHLCSCSNDRPKGRITVADTVDARYLLPVALSDGSRRRIDHFHGNNSSRTKVPPASARLSFDSRGFYHRGACSWRRWHGVRHRRVYGQIERIALAPPWLVFVSMREKDVVHRAHHSGEDIDACANIKRTVCKSARIKEHRMAVASPTRAQSPCPSTSMKYAHSWRAAWTIRHAHTPTRRKDTAQRQMRRYAG